MRNRVKDFGVVNEASKQITLLEVCVFHNYCINAAARVNHWYSLSAQYWHILLFIMLMNNLYAVGKQVIGLKFDGSPAAAYSGS